MNDARQMYSLDIHECAELISIIGKNQTVLAQGDMGSAKSAMLGLLADMLPTHKPYYFDCTTKVDAGDMGMPKMKEAEGKDFFTHATTQELGFHEEGPIILMLDEIGKNRSILNPLNRVMYEKKFGPFSLHPDSIVFATTNKSGEGLGDILQPHHRNRITIVQIKKLGHLRWIEWGLDNDVDPVMLGWVKDNPHVAQSFEEVPNPQENTMIFHPKDPSRQSFWTWRSAEAASDILKKRHLMSNHMVTSALMGTVGEQAALQLMSFVNVANELPSADSIKKDPDNAIVPTAAAAKCMVVYRTLSTIERDWVDAWMTYMERLDKEAQGLFVNGVRSEKYSKQSIVMQNKKFGEWSRNHGYMFQTDKV
jgi:hypothetical protein